MIASRKLEASGKLKHKTASPGGNRATRGLRLWLGVEDSNLGIRIQSPLSYH